MRNILHSAFLSSSCLGVNIGGFTLYKNNFPFYTKQSLFIFLATMFTLSCQQRDKKEVTPVFQDPDWIRLEIPNGREAYAIAGDIEKTLLVTTYTKAYYTMDQGKTWQESIDFHGPTPGLFVSKDTTFSLQASCHEESKPAYACGAQYFTTDYGRSWQHCGLYYTTYAGYQYYSKLSLPIGSVKTNTNITYRIKQNLTPTFPGSNSFYFNPSGLQREDSFGIQAVRFPFKHKLMNLYLDSNSRLYVAASGGTFTKDNIHYCCENNMPAIIYVSKKPLP